MRDIEALAQPLGFNWSKAQLLSSKASSRAAQPAVSYFLRSFDGSGSIPIVDEAVAARLEGVTNLRLLPGTFPEGMDYHFDGLAAPDRTYAFPPPVDLDAYAAACRLPPADETEDEREARFQRERHFGL